MRISFYGVRGSIPAPGPDTNRYGGNTSCVAVRAHGGDLLILDAGTGMAVLGRELLATEFGKGAGRATLLLSHTHWDHIQGFPFCPPVYIPGNRWTIYGPAHSAELLEGTLEGQMSPHFSPIHSLKNLGAQVECRVAPCGERFEVSGLGVTARANPHGRTTALAYRIEEGRRALVYASDAGYPDGRPSPEVAALYRGADLLVHDCTYTPEDRASRADRGFSSIADAARAAAEARVGRLAMFHYDQDYGDDMVDQLRERCRRLLDQAGGREVDLVAAHEGLTIDL